MIKALRDAGYSVNKAGKGADLEDFIRDNDIENSAVLKWVTDSVSNSDIVEHINEDGGEIHAFNHEEELIDWAKNNVGEDVFSKDTLGGVQKLEYLRQIAKECDIPTLETICKTFCPEPGAFYHLAK